MKVYVINFQEVSQHSSGNALVRSLLDIFEDLDDNYIFLTSYVDKQYKSNIKGHGRLFYFLFRLLGYIFVKLRLQFYIRRTILERMVDFAHYLTLRREKEPYVLITSQYAPYSVRFAAKHHNKTILIAGNLNDELYYNTVTQEKERLGLKFQDIYSSKFRISVYKSMMEKIDEVWCFTPLCVKSFQPKRTKLIPPIVEIKKDEICKDIESDNKELVLGYIGFTSLLKGVHLLVDAVSRSRHCSDIKLKICGSVDPQMEFLLHNEKVDVELLGYIPEKDKESVIKRFDCIVIPSLYDAGPTTIVEGIKCNVPVLASSGCGYADYIKDIPGCFVFETQNIPDLTAKIDYIFENKKRIFALLSNGVTTLGGINPPEITVLSLIKKL